MPTSRQRERYSEVMGGDIGEESDGTIDSNSSEYYQRQTGGPIPYRMRYKAVVKCWNDMDMDKKQAWRGQAKKSNSRNLPGKLYYIPSKFPNLKHCSHHITYPFIVKFLFTIQTLLVESAMI